MPGNKKSKRKPGKSRVHTFTTKGMIPIIFRNDAETERELKLMAHSDLAAIRDGQGTQEQYWTVANRLNWANTLASMVEFSFDPAPTINAGLDAVLALNKRFIETGKLALEAGEVAAVGEALTLADDMQDATTRRQHRDAMRKLHAEFPETIMGA
jgi:hypothetical protein